MFNVKSLTFRWSTQETSLFMAKTPNSLPHMSWLRLSQINMGELNWTHHKSTSRTSTNRVRLDRAVCSGSRLASHPVTLTNSSTTAPSSGQRNHHAPKRDKSWTFSDHISVCFLSLSPGFVLRDVRFGLKVGRFSIQWDKSETFKDHISVLRQNVLKFYCKRS